MAFPTAVNSQITDAVTQPNVKTLGESPAVAMSMLYQSLAQATGVLFQNAVSAQQQMNTIAQAATQQGVLQIYNVDTHTATTATRDITSTSTPDRLTGLLDTLRAPAVAADVAMPPPVSTTTDNDDAHPGIAGDIRDAVRFVNDHVLGRAEAFNANLRQCTDSFAHAIAHVHHAQQQIHRRVLLDAAMATALQAMLREPQRAKEYEEVLQAIKRMG